MNGEVAGLVVAQHPYSRAIARQILTSHGHRAGSSPAPSQRDGPGGHAEVGGAEPLPLVPALAIRPLGTRWHRRMLTPRWRLVDVTFRAVRGDVERSAKELRASTLVLSPRKS